MASHLYNLRDTEKSHHYNLRDSTASATKDQMLHTTADQRLSHTQNEAHTYAQAVQGHVQGQGQEHTQKSQTGQQHHQQHQQQHQQHRHQQQHQQRDHPAAVKLATGTEANLEHPVNPDHDLAHPGH
ncbi:hypothetical protein BGZ97_006107 [Linnemannia gamsii]|uniref:Uncharacterized protein n=1 Tax=Linnemannia gamsii TaxID=64522 RepID=A0A9P6UFR6_9FUNG|nr:hypothetical protein BGZ97_006107 [Linnemannia gamsii]